jgi:hypothetical protein
VSDASSPETFAATCPSCDQAVIMVVKGQWEVHDPEHGPPTRWSAGHCPRCEAPVLYGQEYMQVSAQEWDWDSPWQVHPPRDRRMSTAVPKALRLDHEEARLCFRAKCYTASAIMARRIVQGICIEQGYDKRNLFDSLKAMRDAGVIDDRLYEWADAARDVGNQGAHEYGAQVSREDASEVLNFTEALLDYLYVFQARYAEFKERRDAVAAKKPTKKAAKKGTRKAAHERAPKEPEPT